MSNPKIPVVVKHGLLMDCWGDPNYATMIPLRNVLWLQWSPVGDEEGNGYLWVGYGTDGGGKHAFAVSRDELEPTLEYIGQQIRLVHGRPRRGWWSTILRKEVGA